MSTPRKASRKTSAKRSTRRPTIAELTPGLQAGLPRELGMQVRTITPNKVQAEMHVQAKHLTRWGYVHGGAIMALGDAIGAAGAVVNLKPGERTVTLESKTNFFTAGRPPLLKAVSIPLHKGRRTMVWQTTIRNEDGSRVAIVTQTQVILTPDKGADA